MARDDLRAELRRQRRGPPCGARSRTARQSPRTSPCAPASTSRSEARPIAGLAVMPLVPSEPPHLVPTMRSASADRQRAASRAISRQRLRDPLAPGCDRVARVPPSFWITRTSTGPARRADRPTGARRSNSSQPSETSSTAADVRMGAERAPSCAGRRRSGSSPGSRSAGRRPRSNGRGDGAGDVVGALDQIGDQHVVADALAPVRPEPAADRRPAAPHSSKWSMSLVM